MPLRSPLPPSPTHQQPPKCTYPSRSSYSSGSTPHQRPQQPRPRRTQPANPPPSRSTNVPTLPATSAPTPQKSSTTASPARRKYPPAPPSTDPTDATPPTANASPQHHSPLHPRRPPPPSRHVRHHPRGPRPHRRHHRGQRRLRAPGVGGPVHVRWGLWRFHPGPLGGGAAADVELAGGRGGGVV